MLRLGASNEKLSVVNDQFGSPTYTVDLAVTLADMIVTDKYGVYHATNEGFCSWFEFADEIFRQSNLDVHIIPVDSSAFPTKAARPLNSRMSKEKLRESGFSKLPSWKDALARYLNEINCEPNKQ
jgi:dTDP-4-dehydrorhamnose reductase